MTPCFDLDFKPRQPSPEFCPPFVWQGWALNHFQGTTATPIEVQDFETTFHYLYRQLSLPEAARLVTAAEQKSIAIDWPRLFKLYQMGWNDRFYQLLKALLTTPPRFQDWVTEKQASAKDLMPLLSIKSAEQRNDLLLVFMTLPMTRSEGVNALELLVELVLLDTLLTQLQPQLDETVKMWTERLHRMRFPRTQAAESSCQKELMDLPWSKSYQTRWVRQGDRSGLEIKFTVHSLTDLQNKIQNLKSFLPNETNDSI